MSVILRKISQTDTGGLFWLAIFNLLLFAPAIQSMSGFSFIDEVCVILLASISVVRLIKGDGDCTLLARSASACFACLTLTILIGIAGNLAFRVQTQATPIAIDIFAFIKFPVAILSACLALRGKGCLLELIEIEAKLLVVVMLACAIGNLFFDFGMGVDPRYGLRASFKFVFTHPTYVSFACVGMLIVFLTSKSKNLGWIVGCLAVCALTLRAKSLAFVALVALVLFATRDGRRFAPIYGFMCAVAVVAIGVEQLSYYFVSTGFARGELARASLAVAADYFPLGTGFATFGSNITASQQYYSPLYYEYNLSTVWGLEPGEVFFLSDAFWSTILAQLGWVGLVAYVAMLVSLLLLLLKMHENLKPSILCCFVYLLISSTAESAFFNPQAVFLAFCLGAVLANTKSVFPDNVKLAPTSDVETPLPGLSSELFSSAREAEGITGRKPLVSVVVPIYQNECYLDECIRSILGQTLTNIEIVLVDDGSPDACGAIADGYAERDARVKVLHVHNGGCSRARNSGIAAASGVFVGFVDSDDWIEPQMYERLLSAAVRSDVEIVYGGMREVCDGNVVNEYRHSDAVTILRDRDEIARLRCRFYGALPCKSRGEIAYGSACTGVYRRAFLLDNGINFLDAFSEDILFNIEALRFASSVAFVDGSDYCYRKDGQQSVTNSFEEYTIARYFDLFDRLWRMAESELGGYSDECSLRARRLIIDYSRVLIVLIERSALSKELKREYVRTVCNGLSLRRAVRGYPFWRLPLAQAVFFICLKMTLVRVLEVLVSLRGCR